MAAALGNKYSQKYTPEMIKELCDELMIFAEEDKTVHFVSFARRKGKTFSWLHRMSEDYPEFEDAYKAAKELMAEKLVRSSIYGDSKNPNFNGTHAMSWKNIYSQEWKDYEKWKAEISKNIEQNVSTTEIVKELKNGSGTQQ